jgi:hypothetical protein
MLLVFEKISRNFSLIFRLIIRQFFLKNIFLFFVLPIAISFYITISNSNLSILYNNDNISLIMTIISLIWWILLNFLILILQDEKSILYRSWIKESYWTYLWKYDDKWKRVIITVSYFQFIYDKIFFIILLSILYVIFFVFYKFWVFDFLKWELIIFSNNITEYKKWIIYFPYIFFIIFYFLNIFYLLLKLSFLLQNNKK